MGWYVSRLPKTLMEFFPDRISEIKPNITPEEEAALREALQKKNGLSYYDMLGITSAATPEEIRKAYKARSLLCHPDRFSDPDKSQQKKNAEVFFKIVGKAYEILSDVDARRLYDRPVAISSFPLKSEQHYHQQKQQQQQDQTAQSQTSMTDEAHCIQLLRGFFIPEEDCVAYAKQISYQKLSDALKNYWEPDPAIYVFIALKTTSKTLKDEFIADIKNKAQRENELKAKACRHDNKTAEQFDQCSLSVRTDIERAVCEIKMRNHDGARSFETSLQHDVTRKFQLDFINLINEGEQHLLVAVSDLSSGRKDRDGYGHEIAGWLKEISAKINQFCSELREKQIQIRVNESSSPYDQLMSMIRFFYITSPFNSYDLIDSRSNALFQKIEMKATFGDTATPMSTFAMQAEYLLVIVRKLENRLDILERPSPDCYRHSQSRGSSSPSRVKRVSSPTVEGQQLSQLDGLKNKIELVIKLNKQNSEITEKLNALSDWKEAFGVFPTEIQEIEKQLNKNNEMIATDLLDIARQSGSSVDVPYLADHKKFIMLKTAVLLGIRSYLTNSEGKSAKSDGVARATLLEGSLKGIQNDGEFFNMLAAHLGRVEGSGLFKHAGRLNVDSLDTCLLDTIKRNETAFNALQDKVQAIRTSDSIEMLRDKIVAQCKQPSSAAAASAAASSFKR